MTPAAFHRIATSGEDTKQVYTSWSAIRMPSTTVAWVLPRQPRICSNAAFLVVLAVRLPYDKRKARLISIRDGLLTKSEFSKLITGKPGNLFQRSAPGKCGDKGLQVDLE